ncbi:hypothetical protein ACR9WD_07995 [Glutamicibacter sp. PAEs-4]|uniref:hypothetical protein n=1 Tax=Glutamicibacter sp. PAEs-4 TaxID=3444114 RepID=UPI003EC0CF31
MSNISGAKTSREEEIAFLAMEQVLGVEITLADAGGGSKMPDGSWETHTGRCIVEVTSPPATALMAEWARAKKEGRPQIENGSMPVRMNDLAAVCNELLESTWAIENITKLRAQPAKERHLFLFARSYDVGDYFYRLSNSYEDGAMEQVEDITLPEGISDVWFRGQARRGSAQQPHATSLWIARFQAGVGWHRHVVVIDELDLPSPAPGIADDPVPAELRHPKDRT